VDARTTIEHKMSFPAQRQARLAAWAALVAALGVVVALLVLLFRDFRALLLVLAALAIGGAAGWIALTRRGLARLLAVLVAILALAGGVVVLIRQGSVDELIWLWAALTIFGILTRTALRQAAVGKQSSAQSPPARSNAAAHRHRAVLLMNPKSGDGKPERFHLVDEAKRRGIDPILLGPGDDWRAVAREAARSADVIGMAGGDGSQALVAQIAMEYDLPYVCIPAGTRNHLALDLGLDRDDIVGALDAFTGEFERCIDLTFVNDRIFVNNVSLGIYAEIVQSDAYREAKIETMEKMLPELLGPRAAAFDLRYRGPQGEEHRSAQLILVSNNPYQLDRLAGMGSRPQLDTGKLGIVTLDIKNAAQAAELLSLEAVGQVRRFKGWMEWSAPEFDVDSSAAVAAGIDGEAVMLDPPLRFRIVPAALHVRLPPTSVGLSAAALKPGLTGSGIGNLWRIAAGRG
jgi:diacylglycerol kinase family enzyme